MTERIVSIVQYWYPYSSEAKLDPHCSTRTDSTRYGTYSTDHWPPDSLQKMKSWKNQFVLVCLKEKQVYQFPFCQRFPPAERILAWKKRHLPSDIHTSFQSSAA